MSEKAGIDGLGMIEAIAPIESIRRSYDFQSRFYSWLIAPLERRPRLLALERANIQPHERILEVAVGPGAALLETLKRVDRSNVVDGVDLSPMMLARARRRAESAGYANVRLQQADARSLPFADGTFDVLSNSYMLDLIPLRDIPTVLGEFRRVLKPRGRLVLLNLSKRDATSRVLWERIYELLPSRLVPYLLGGCRPVLMERPLQDAGFVDVRREFVPNVIPSEVVTARTS